MSKLENFLNDKPVHPPGVEFHAAVNCHTCGEAVPDQEYFPEDSVLVWTCPSGHRSIMENFNIF